MVVKSMECCGIAELSGVGASKPDEILASILAAQEARKGMVIATSVGSQRLAPSKLEGLSFEKIKTFKNPNTGHIVTMWMRSTTLTTDEKAKAEAWGDVEERADLMGEDW